MTIGFRIDLAVSFEKMTICCRSVNFFVVCLTGKSENLEEIPILKDIFIFLANGRYFQKCSFVVEILSFLKEVSSVFGSVKFWWRCFLLVTNVILCKKC